MGCIARPHDRPMHVSIIICTRNRRDALQSTLASLARVESPAGSSVELIVADNGSTDGTASVLNANSNSKFATRHLVVAEPGKSTALNAALHHATGDILVFTDDDVIPQPEWLERITRPITSGQADAVAGTITMAPHLRRPWMRKLHRAWLAATDEPKVGPPETLIGANMAICRDVLGHVPRFDPELGPGKLGLWEDTLFGLQIRQAGLRITSAANAVVEHHFLPDRLLRGAFLSRAIAEARSSAYVDWHWRHADPALSRSGVWKLKILLWTKRCVRWREWHREEGAPEWELNLLTGIEHAIGLHRERQRKQNYDRLGLRSRCGAIR
jgi:glucosyl-dolichyl phosphate glucuronosyltransferase